MTDHTYPPGRLVKVLLPSHLVAAMDELVASQVGYASRAEFIADAIDGHLAELRLHGGEEGGAPSRVGEPPLPDQAHGGSVAKPRPVVAAVPPMPEGIPTLEHEATPPVEPTWGMHNRDFPTLWALTHLCRATISSDSPVLFSAWIPEVVADAWDLGRRLPTDKFDVSGFPTNPRKHEASEGRFVRFFIGDSPGVGPMFELALAAADGEGRVAPTPAGLTLLGDVEGFSCERGRGIPEAWTSAYLVHLSQHAPADLAFMAEVLDHIQGGHDDRTGLVEATAEAHPGWSESVVDTNVAGFIARAREWGLLLPRQRKGRYVLEDDAMELVQQVTKS